MTPLLAEQAPQRPQRHTNAHHGAETEQQAPKRIVDGGRNERECAVERSFRSDEGDPAGNGGEGQKEDCCDGVASAVIAGQQHEADEDKHRSGATDNPTGCLENEVVHWQEAERSGANCDTPDQAEQCDPVSHYRSA